MTTKNETAEELPKSDSSQSDCSTSFLFPVETIEKPSPKLEWLKTHNISTKYRRDLPTDCGRWEAYVGDYNAAIDKTFNDDDAYDGYPCESPFLASGMSDERCTRTTSQESKSRSLVEPKRLI